VNVTWEDGSKSRDNALFVAAARTAVPALLDALDAAEAQIVDLNSRGASQYAAVEAAEAALEIVRMQLAACGVIAMANTAESAKDARDMHQNYDCASVRDVASAVDREMAAREKLEAAEAREKLLREALFRLCAWAEGAYASSPNITTYKPIGNARAALAETAP